ncbi:MAG: DegV family protein [Acholeplasma sp.]|nr:DegV family protein [Acholeplasma sp.]
MNKNKIGIVVDSTFKVNEAFLKEKDIRVVYLDIIVGDKTYKDGEVSNEQIYEMMDKNIKVTTSQPAPNRFMNAYQSLLDDGYESVICLTVSSSLSGTFNSANLGKDMLEDPTKVMVYDTKSAICGAEYLTERLVHFTETLDSKEAVHIAFLEQRNKGSLIFTVDDLMLLVKSGRLSRLSGMIGNLLKIKPILRFDQGKLEVEHKVRSNENVIKYLVSEVGKLASKAKTVVRISYTTTSDLGLKFLDEIKKSYEHVSIQLSDKISAVIAVHVGKAGLGIYLGHE